ncbi:glycosyl hydrolase 115 family protein (plasmid) [Sphingomonas sp. NY01]|uniref:glycosyl hydrolase 115 family protein n=1 Tax=Sphingomonas sp. NY01 TaxID=2968057 RepID=UPI00315CF2C5
MKSRLCCIALSILSAGAAGAEPAMLVTPAHTAGIIHEDDIPLTLSADLLARDLKAVTGKAATLSTDLHRCTKICVVIARYDSALARSVADDAGLDLRALAGQWERYERVLLRSRRDPETSYLLIAGSDRRGTIWGVVDLTREIGVSAWEWWADVAPRHADRVAVAADRIVSRTPSVQYRGIFLNDEDWGLQPWAAKTFEPDVGDIGPKTYSRIFELMWRLKANTLWPAMHDSTRPFYQIRGNAEAARDHAIVMGTSHAEPMMRNNVREWDDDVRGPFNFFTNRTRMIEYWNQRAQEVRDFENIYTIGLRGKHDSGMQGADTAEAARDATAQAIAIQRDLLAKAQRKPADRIPQVLTLYKEVLDTYRAGLDVPKDVTLIWPEDNYGYINQLSGPADRRAGGSGVYYHISYWGRPHDYLWLATTHPALLREQMDRAYRMDARRIWIVNVGDIKPGEYLTQYFLDLAFDDRLFATAPIEHLTAWAGRQFGPRDGRRIASIMMDYYDLAFERRPEFMGGGQTEPTSPNTVSPYVRTGGDEAWQRLDRYADLTRRAEEVARSLPGDRRDAYFQLVLYPVRASASLNERILKLDLATTYAKAGRAPLNVAIRSDGDPAARAADVPRAAMNALVGQARAAHARLVGDTATYNALNAGKWKGIMNMAPRGLPVFDEPAWPSWSWTARPGCGLDLSALTFVEGQAADRSFAIYSAGSRAHWTFTPPAGFTASAREGDLDEANGYQMRIRLSYAGAKAPSPGTVECGGRKLPVEPVLAARDGRFPPEVNRIISMPAVRARSSQWETVPGLGSRGAALRARLDVRSSESATGEPLVYDFRTNASGDARLRVVAIPVHPLTSSTRLRLGVSIDGGPMRTLDFETFGRSEEWKRNVLSNTAIRELVLPELPSGSHRVSVHALDPGFIIDRLDVLLDGAPDFYGASLLP